MNKSIDTSINNNPQVSVIIPTLNEQEYIGNILKDLTTNKYNNLEIIISDNESTDKTLKIAESYSRSINNLEIITTNKKGVSKTRNAGAKIAKGKYILFIDADSRIPAQYIEKSVKEIQQKDLGVANHYITPISNKLSDIIMVNIVNYTLKLMQHITPGGPGSGGIMIKKKLHEDINGFDETITKIGEDVDYQHRASKKEKFGMLNSEKTYFDMRRFDDEGRTKVWMKWAAAYGMHLFRLNMRSFPAQYKFGTF